MYCDFSTVTDILLDHLSGTTIGNCKGLMDALFSSYLKSIDKFTFDRKVIIMYDKKSKKTSEKGTL